LNATATDYRSLGNLEDAEFHAGWDTLRPILSAAQRKLTRREIFDAWPRNGTRPARNTLWRWLDYAVNHGHAHKDGTRVRKSPFRFWLTESLDRWQREGTAEYVQQQADDDWQLRMRGWREPLPRGSVSP